MCRFTENLHQFTFNLLLQASTGHRFGNNYSLKYLIMKKSILISCALVTIFSLTAYGFVNSKKQKSICAPACNKELSSETKVGCVKSDNDSEKKMCKPPSLIDQALLVKQEEEVDEQELTFVYNIDSRFRTTITKSDLRNANTIYDLYPKEATEDKKAFNENKLVFLEDEGNIVEYGNGINFTEAQKQLFERMDYSDNFYFTVDCSHEIGESGYTNEEYILYYLTILPETQAEYKSGKTALIDYLKIKSKDFVQNLDPGKLIPGTVSFVVNPMGEIENVTLEHTCGFSGVDQRMIDILNNVPGTWTPAKNSIGEPVSQSYIFSYGRVGC